MSPFSPYRDRQNFTANHPKNLLYNDIPIQMNMITKSHETASIPNTVSSFLMSMVCVCLSTGLPSAPV
jgi:hypothetical protein